MNNFSGMLRSYIFFIVSLYLQNGVLAAIQAPVNSQRDEALVEMGRRAFFDKRLSEDGKTACASCHRPDHALQDGRVKAQGAFGQIGTRNTPSLFNVARQKQLFWDGRRASLQTQALDPLLNPREQGFASTDRLIDRLKALPEYRALFGDRGDPTSLGEAASSGPTSASWPSTPVLLNLGRALAAFEGTLSDGSSAFDRFFFAGDLRALTASQQRGWHLFQGSAGCIACHQVGSAAPAMFTDQNFHALPLRNLRINAHLDTLVRRLVAERDHGRSIDDILLSDSRQLDKRSHTSRRNRLHLLAGGPTQDHDSKKRASRQSGRAAYRVLLLR